MPKLNLAGTVTVQDKGRFIGYSGEAEVPDEHFAQVKAIAKRRGILREDEGDGTVTPVQSSSPDGGPKTAATTKETPRV